MSSTRQKNADARLAAGGRLPPDRMIPPVPPAGAVQRLPPPDADTVLANGLRLVIVRTSALPLIELRLVIPHGPGSVTDWQLLAAGLTAGTPTRDAARTEAELGAVGGELTAQADAWKITVTGHCLSEGWDTLLEVAADGLLHARFPRKAVEAERTRLSVRQRMARAQPAVLAHEALQRHRYGDRAAARLLPGAGPCGTGPGELRALRRDLLHPTGSTLVLVGDVHVASAVERITGLLGGWHSPSPEPSVPVLPPVAGGPPLLVDRPGAAQSRIRLSAPAVPRTDPRFPALHLADLVFGGCFSARLVTRLREEKGYAYRIGSGFESVPGAASLMVEADTSPAHTTGAVNGIAAELERFVASPPTPREVESARRYAAGSLGTGMSTPAALATALANLCHIGAGADWLHRWRDLIVSVRAEEVAEAARRFYRTSAFTGVVVADMAGAGAGLEAAAAAFGK